MSIHNGCVCCSLRKDILSALAELSRRSEQANRPYDNVVLETTGLADPAPVAFTFFANPWTKARYHLDSIVYATPCQRLCACSFFYWAVISACSILHIFANQVFYNLFFL